jgi:hypothetical protein
MEFGTLVSLGGGVAALRVAFLAACLGSPERLWSDYERRGSRFHLARGLDYMTFGIFLVGALWCLWRIDGQDPWRLGKVFVAWLGCSLLARLPVHRFPRTNLPGALSAAKIDLAVHLLLSLLTAVAATAAAWAYFWYRA